MGKVRENQNLIHLSESFWTLGGICKNRESLGEISEVFPFYFIILLFLLLFYYFYFFHITISDWGQPKDNLGL